MRNAHLVASPAVVAKVLHRRRQSMIYRGPDRRRLKPPRTGSLFRHDQRVAPRSDVVPVGGRSTLGRQTPDQAYFNGLLQIAAA